MKTAIGREAFRITAGLAAIVAMAALQASCDARHVLGTLEPGSASSGSGGTPTTASGSGGSPGVGGGPFVGGGAGAPGSGGSPFVFSSGGGGEVVIGGPPPPDAGGTLPTDAGSNSPDVGVLGVSQTWTGYVENYHFPSGSDVISITFASDAAGNMVGTVTLGTGTPPPPATDPNVGYPPGYNANTPGYVAEGFAYSMNAGIVMADRMRFDVRLSQLWQGWCALQTPQPDGFGGYRCYPAGYFSDIETSYGPSPTDCVLIDQATNTQSPIDCGRAFAAGNCSCSSSSCTVIQDGEDLSFDLSINGARSDGSVVGDLGDHNVHLTQDTKDP